MKASNRVGIARLDPRILPSNKPKETLDQEFHFADEFDEKLALELKLYEEQQHHVKSSNLSKEEEQRLFEMNVEARKIYRWAHQEDFKQQREGKIIHYFEFMRRLKRALPAGITAWLSDKGGMAKTLGLYVGHPGMLGPVCATKHKSGDVHYVTYVQVPYMQEYEELHFDRYDVPLGSKRRGWRTVLLNLIEQKVITEKAAHREFGDPAPGPVSLRYREYLHYLRNKKLV